MKNETEPEWTVAQHVETSAKIKAMEDIQGQWSMIGPPLLSIRQQILDFQEAPGWQENMPLDGAADEVAQDLLVGLMRDRDRLDKLIARANRL